MTERRAALLCLLLLAGLPAVSAGSDETAKVAVPTLARDRNPVVVELFQSQGCSSCPPANANLNAIAGVEGILALSFAVDYWDRLGWRDSFAKPQFTQRERDYAARNVIRVATPQMVINGRIGLIGNDRRELSAKIVRAGPLTGPVIDRTGETLRVGPGRRRSEATVWLVRYDPREQAVAIRAGENRGRTLPHRNVVRELTALGSWNGAEARYKLSGATDPALRDAILIQDGVGGPIIAARKL